MSRVAAGFVSPFGVSGDLGVGTGSILGANAEASASAASITNGNNKPAGPFAALSTAASADQTPTIEALSTGKLTGKQQRIISTLGATPDTPTSIPWTDKGTEPTVIATIRKYGWIKLVKPDYNPKTRLVTAATYKLTTIGKAINIRTGGGKVTGSSGVNILA
jgi:hypothetical protein